METFAHCHNRFVGAGDLAAFLLRHRHAENLTNKLLTVAGLNIDIIGVVVASLKTPFYGIFFDGGQIEITRANVEKKYFQFGMCLIALGFFLQALGTLLDGLL